MISTFRAWIRGCSPGNQRESYTDNQQANGYKSFHGSDSSLFQLWIVPYGLDGSIGSYVVYLYRHTAQECSTCLRFKLGILSITFVCII